MPEVSIVLPAYEEAANLEVILPKLRQSANSLGRSWEIIVIDSRLPRDQTAEVCQRNQVRCVARREGEMYGHAIRTALAEAKGRWVILMDADGSHNPAFLPSLWEHRETADLVIASRYVKGGRTENPAALIFMSLMVNVAFRLVLGLKCHDVSNSFRLYRGDHLRSLGLRCNHFDIVEEMLVKLVAARPGYRLKEVPCVFEKRKAGKTKRNLFLFALSYLIVLARLMKIKYEAHSQKV